MPKETVGDLAGTGFRVEVGWRRGDDVQIATTNPDSPLTQDDGDPTEKTSVNGWWVTLDRDGINKLIRDLRRARDQAYGQDA